MAAPCLQQINPNHIREKHDRKSDFFSTVHSTCFEIISDTVSFYRGRRRRLSIKFYSKMYCRVLGYFLFLYGSCSHGNPQKVPIRWFQEKFSAIEHNYLKKKKIINPNKQFYAGEEAVYYYFLVYTSVWKRLLKQWIL